MGVAECSDKYKLLGYSDSVADERLFQQIQLQVFCLRDFDRTTIRPPPLDAKNNRKTQENSA
jgi:hypothetical protein